MRGHRINELPLSHRHNCRDQIRGHPPLTTSDTAPSLENMHTPPHPARTNGLESRAPRIPVFFSALIQESARAQENVSDTTGFMEQNTDRRRVNVPLGSPALNSPWPQSRGLRGAARSKWIPSAQWARHEVPRKEEAKHVRPRDMSCGAPHQPPRPPGQGGPRTCIAICNRQVGDPPPPDRLLGGPQSPLPGDHPTGAPSHWPALPGRGWCRRRTEPREGPGGGLCQGHVSLPAAAMASRERPEREPAPPRHGRRGEAARAGAADPARARRKEAGRQRRHVGAGPRHRLGRGRGWAYGRGEPRARGGCRSVLDKGLGGGARHGGGG